MLTSAQNEYSNLRDESTENTRSRLASIGLTADLAALIAINICFVTLGALLYSALRRLGSTVSRMQRYVVTIGTVFFVALLLRSVYAPHQPAAENSAACSHSVVLCFDSRRAQLHWFSCCFLGIFCRTWIPRRTFCER